MSGETNLSVLLKSMNPHLNEGNYVFCQVDRLPPIPLDNILCFFREAEGITLILPEAIAQNHGIPYFYTARWISLTVHSSLEAVGLTAAFATALAEKGISCNVVAACYHDHLFVSTGDAERAMETLRAMSQ